MSSRSRNDVVSLLTHYMRTVFEAAGLGWDADNTGEMEQLVDAIEEMVADEVAALAEEAK